MNKYSINQYVKIKYPNKEPQIQKLKVLSFEYDEETKMYWYKTTKRACLIPENILISFN